VGFINTFRTLCIDPPAEIRVMFEHVRAAPPGDITAPRYKFGGLVGALGSEK